MDFKNEALLALETVGGKAAGLFSIPSLRLGVTGLSRAGKTVFITALVHNLLQGGRLHAFKAHSSGRLARAHLAPQPDDTVPRFQYEKHLEALVKHREWPSSTRTISELRLVLEFESESFWARNFRSNRLALDIVDYPGEWLLDLALMNADFESWSKETLAQAALPNRQTLARDWLEYANDIDPKAAHDEGQAQTLHDLFADYLKRCREDRTSLSALPPGRFLMPGDMEGSPALTFAPLALDEEARAETGSWHWLMRNRFNAYKREVVYPFFREHFARLDRQIVLVDTLQALNAGPYAVSDLSRALTDILAAFRPGKASFLNGLIGTRMDRIAFAATKADHVHHADHDRLADILSILVEDALARAEYAGADVETMALSAVRATREGQVNSDGQELPVLIGVPEAGQKIGDVTYDGETEAAIFPGDLPENARSTLSITENESEALDISLNFIRFRPPEQPGNAQDSQSVLPHIRMDRALEFLLGDRLS